MAGNTKTVVKKHERGPVRILVTVLGILGMIGGAVFMLGGAVSGNPQLFGIGGFGFVFWLVMALIARPKTEVITETVYTPSPSSDSHNISNMGGFNN